LAIAPVLALFSSVFTTPGTVVKKKGSPLPPKYPIAILRKKKPKLRKEVDDDDKKALS
jgi:hypothetical protein